MIYTNPNESNAKYKVKEQYSNFIDGSWIEPQEGEYFDNISHYIWKNNTWILVKRYNFDDKHETT